MPLRICQAPGTTCRDSIAKATQAGRRVSYREVAARAGNLLQNDNNCRPETILSWPWCGTCDPSHAHRLLCTLEDHYVSTFTHGFDGNGRPCRGRFYAFRLRPVGG